MINPDPDIEQLKDELDKAWVEKMIEQKEFGSLSHAIEKALIRLKDSYSANSGKASLSKS